MRQAPSGGAMLTSLIPFALIFVVFYFLLIAPQRKQQKELERMLAALKKGDRVVTSGGLHGTIVEFKEADRTVVLEIAQGVRVTVSRSAVTTVKQVGAQ
ncbi:MAG: preprotein translocase subunit YajC [Candidatus Coatesbacteria bacterium]